MPDTRPLVIYHKGCADGAGAAYAAWCRFGENAEYRPAQYGDPAPTDTETAGRHLFICDFSFKRVEMLRLARASARLVVLDHHATAQADLDGLVAEIAGDAREEGQHLVVFDMEKSGAVLAWEHFHPGKEIPNVLLYIQDRDLWQWQLVGSRAVSAGLLHLGIIEDFRRLDGLCESSEGILALNATGSTILSYQERLVESICKNAEEIRFGDHLVLAVNTPVLQSEVAGKLAEGRPFGLAWFRAHDKFIVSLRSSPEGADVQAIATQFGGGGHVHAAGFQRLEWESRPWTEVAP